MTDAQPDHRQGRQGDQPRDAAEYPAPPPAPYLAAEYPIYHRMRALLDGTTRPERARDAVMAGALTTAGH